MSVFIQTLPRLWPTHPPHGLRAAKFWLSTREAFAHSTRTGWVGYAVPTSH